MHDQFCFLEAKKPGSCPRKEKCYFLHKIDPRNTGNTEFLVKVEEERMLKQPPRNRKSPGRRHQHSGSAVVLLDCQLLASM